ncbi:MAG: carbamoyltransferase HypF [Anaerolineaceae bacterium]|nr:carbamoyltransferase HypF [Anaerolineaceae bacterium]
MCERICITIQGAVQGVGFRPFVYRLAHDLGVTGWVNNSPQGVTIEAEASPDVLRAFVTALREQKPPHAQINHLSVLNLPPHGSRDFEIHPSDHAGTKSAVILPDYAVCADCLRELFDPNDRRYLYPFINCTHCGPRYSIITGLPYDRPATTMASFEMCEDCRAEYENPLNRRFHAQPIACPKCGPQLTLWDTNRQALAVRHAALLLAAGAIRQGKIVALKGLGGFQLLCDAANPQAVMRLRQRKNRAHKPFALMFPRLEQIQQVCEICPLETGWLTASEAPIVLLRKKLISRDDPIAPDNAYLGVMLPYTPLHHLLMRELDFPIVATSGNISGEPICIDNQQALTKLHDIADLWLIHDRPITRPIDDSVVQVVNDDITVLRRARGFPLNCGTINEINVLAVGGQQKNTIALSNGVLSQHIGDMDSVETETAFKNTIQDLQTLYDFQPHVIACDLHPDYHTTRCAEAIGLPIMKVQHHYAHVLACMAENQLKPPVLGVAWDGTGYGTDGTIWGGEFLLVEEHGFRRVGHLRPFYLPGGEQAVREPRRSALGLLYALYGDAAFEHEHIQTMFNGSELSLMQTMLKKRINSPLTTSAGRLFDAIAALLGICPFASFEGQAAIALEAAAVQSSTDECYPYLITEITDEQWGTGHMLETKPMVSSLLEDRSAITDIALKFHNTLANMIVDMARSIAVKKVALTGGCFQNRTLLSILSSVGFHPYHHRLIPPNDGGLSVGQIIAVEMGGRNVSRSSGQNS